MFSLPERQIAINQKSRNERHWLHSILYWDSIPILKLQFLHWNYSKWQGNEDISWYNQVPLCLTVQKNLSAGKGSGLLLNNEKLWNCPVELIFVGRCWSPVKESFLIRRETQHKERRVLRGESNAWVSFDFKFKWKEKAGLVSTVGDLSRPIL